MSDTKEDITRIILDYLRMNPEAGDTLEGISECWVNFKRIEISVDEVENALDRLVEKGKVRKTKIEGSKPVYKICMKT